MKKFNSILFVVIMFFAGASALEAKERIAYSHLTDGYWQIWIMDNDGANKKQMTFSKADKREPAWGSNEKKIAYRTNNGQLFILDLEEESEQEILSEYKNINNPYVSNKNDRIVFVRYDPRAQDKSDIWSADLNGKNARILTKDRVLKYQPVFDAEAKRVAFVRADKAKNAHNIWIMKADGSELKQLTEAQGLETLPDFSPDGAKIAFSSNRAAKNYEIYILNIDNGKVERLTDHSGLDSNPSFSPDGRHLAFVSNRSGNQQIWVINKDTKLSVQLTDGASESIDPAWSGR